MKPPTVAGSEKTRESLHLVGLFLQTSRVTNETHQPILENYKFLEKRLEKMLVFVHHISILNITIKLGNENNYGNLDVSVPVFVMLKGDILANPAKGAMMLE